MANVGKSDVSCCNMALTQLGADRITALDNNTPEGELCNGVYNLLRLELLSLHNWAFATKRATLAQLTTTPNHGFSYSYQLPSDYMRLISLNDSDILDANYKIEEDTLVTDAGTVKIKYIAEISDVQKFPMWFFSLLSARLKMEIAYPITHNNTIDKKALDEFGAKLMMAKNIDANSSGKPTPVKADEWINSRAQNTQVVSSYTLGDSD